MAAHSRRPPRGQHFLHDRSVLRRLAEALSPAPGARVLEIGPGEGALTEFLLAAGAHVTAVEIDSRLAAGLRSKFGRVESLRVVEGDILEFPWEQWMNAEPQRNIRVAGNLPYSITSPVLRKTFACGPRIERAVYLVQEEVARRVVADKGNRDYGLLSLLAALAGERELLFGVRPGSFRPPPRVFSAALRLMPRRGDAADTAFVAFLKRCFRQPRKTLRNNLIGLAPPEKLEVHPWSRSRAQQLSLEELKRLWEDLGRPPQLEGIR